MGVLEEKSYAFAIRTVKCSEHLQNEKKEYIMSKQLLRAGTAVGALIAESKYAQSKLDFINKLSVSIKEANETKYWLRLLKDCGYLQEALAKSLIDDIDSIIKMLSSSIKTSKESIQ